jgi:hypothetical protein
MSPKIIYYYQTFTSLKPILNLNLNSVTHIHLSSIHFGKQQDNTPYIHLNNYPPSDEKFDEVWKELFIATQKNIKVILMVGGAGGAFQDLFSNFEVYYRLLRNLINAKSNTIQGIDLDIEESTDINNIKMLISRVKEDFGPNFIISMAPIQTALQTDNPGLGGFSYKDLYCSEVGKDIDYFNGQFYEDYSLHSYNSVVENGYPEQKVVMGMLMGQDFKKIVEEVKEIYEEYGNSFGGVFIWEYYAAPTNWSQIFYNIFNS